MTLLRSPCWLLILIACACEPGAPTPPDTGIGTAPDATALPAPRDASAAIDAGALDAQANDDAGTVAVIDGGAPDASAPAVVRVRAISPTFGPRSGGTAVTVLGSGFVEGQTQVSIDGVPLADVVVVAPGVLRGVTGAFVQDGAAPVRAVVGGASHSVFGAFLVEGWAYANGGLPRGFRADAIFVDPTDAQVLYMIDDRRLIKSLDGGHTWFPANWDVYTANAASLFIDPARPSRLAMDTMREVWTSDDGGASWVRTAAGRLEAYHRPLIAEGSRPDTQLMVRREPRGPYRGDLDIEQTRDFWQTRRPCRDGGLSVTTAPTVEAVQLALDGETVLASLNGVLHRSLPPGCDQWTRADAGLIGTPSLIQRAHGSATFFALTPDGVFTADGPAEPWTRIGEAAPGTRLGEPLFQAPTRMLVAGTIPPRVFVAAAGLWPTTWVTLTATGTWAPLDLPTPGALGLDPHAPDTLYAAGPAGAFKSVDGGASWRLLTRGPKDGGADRVAVSPRIPTQALAAVGLDLYRTTDGGGAWQRTGAVPTGGDVLSLVYAPRTSSIAFASSGGAVLRTRDGGLTWSDVTPSGPTRGGWLAVAPSSPERLYLMNGQILRSDDHGERWTVVDFADMIHPPLQVDARRPDTLYAPGYDRGVSRSDDGGLTWVDASAGLPADRLVTLLTADPTLPGVLYAAVLRADFSYNDYYKSSDGGRSWDLMPLRLLDRPTVIAVDPLDSDRVYVGGGFRVMRTEDGGGLWRQINRGGQAGHQPAQVPLGLITDLALSPSEAGTFYAAGQGNGAAVLRSTER